MIRPSGIIAAMSTPFFEDETLNEEELRHQVDRLIGAGVHGIFALGTNGENYAMDFAEKVRVMEIVIDQAKHRVPVYVGTGCVTTKETVALTRKAAELKADCASVVSPWFAANTQDGLYRHYKAVAEAAQIPVLIYNMPARTGNNIAPETCAELAKIPNIAGIKDSSGNWENLKGYIHATQGMDFSVLSGNDSLILPALKEGGVGGITAVANIYPETMVSIYRRFLAGDLAGAEEAQNSIAPIRACFKFGNPNTVTKKATNLTGNPVGPCRTPFNYLSDEAVEEIKRTLAEDKVRGMR